MRLRLRALPPPAMLALLYAGFIALGTVLLNLPIAHGGAVGWSEAAFTAVSAVTVTGLVVVDTGSDFTLFGQIVIAILIQVGGLGLMTFAALLAAMIGISIGFGQKAILREELGRSQSVGLGQIVRLVLMIALIAETIGIVLLSTVFVPQFGWSEGIWQAVFHTVSAFNNAGFALFADSLSQWAEEWTVTLTVPGLFILGGIGFVVVGEIVGKRRWRSLSLHSKLMLVGTLGLIAVSWPLWAALEWHNPGTIGAMDLLGKLQASFFQAVTPRTAGFNTVDTAAMSDSATLLTMVLMFIGGGTTSTAGGIKVTTFIVLILATIAFFRQRDTLNAFQRSLGTAEVMKVTALVAISLALIVVVLFLVTLTYQGDFKSIAFEVVSAFGTVGLSLGATGELSDSGRLLIMAMMFLGRVGPLTLGFFLISRARPRVAYPAGDVYLG